MSAEKNWPQSTKHSVEKLEKEVKKLAAGHAALVKAVKGIADALRGKPGLNEGQAKEIFDGLLAHVNKLKGVGKN